MVCTPWLVYAHLTPADTTDFYIFYDFNDLANLHYHLLLIEHLESDNFDAFVQKNYHGKLQIITPRKKKTAQRISYLIAENRYGQSIITLNEISDSLSVKRRLDALHITNVQVFEENKNIIFHASKRADHTDSFLKFYTNTLLAFTHAEQNDLNTFQEKLQAAFDYIDPNDPRRYLHHYLAFARYYKNIGKLEDIGKLKKFHTFFDEKFIYEQIPEQSFFKKNKDLAFWNHILQAEFELFIKKDIPLSEFHYQKALENGNQQLFPLVEIEVEFLHNLNSHYELPKYPASSRRKYLKQVNAICKKYPTKLYAGLVMSSYRIANTFTVELDSISHYLFSAEEFVNNIDFPTTDQFIGETHRLKYEIGAYYLKLGDYERATEYLTQFEDQKYTTSNFHAHKNTHLGKIYESQGNYQKAISYYEDCQNYFEGLDPFYYQWYMANSLYYIGNCHLKSGNSIKGIKNLEQSLQIINTLLKKPWGQNNLDLNDEKFKVRLALAEYYIGQQQPNKASNLIIGLENYDIPDETNFIDLFLLKAKISRHLKQKTIATQNLTSALQQATASFRENKHVKKADIYIEMARTNISFEEYESAIANYNNALSQLLNNIYSFEKLNGNEIARCQFKPQVLTILHEKAALMRELNKTNPAAFPKATIQDCYFSAIDVIRQIRNQYNNDIDKEWLVTNFADLYDNAIDLAYEIYMEDTSNKTQKAHCFFFAEASKSNSLFEALTSNQAKLITGIPDSLIQEGKNLQLRLAHQETQAGSTDTISTTIKENIFKLQNKRDSFELALENNYPAYKNHKYALDHVTVEKMQSFLANQDAQQLEYFIGEQFIYIISITEEEFEIAQIPKAASIDSTLHRFIQLCQSKIRQTSEIAAFQKLGKEIYDLLIANYIKEGHKRLLIVPDGLLTFLPFELLITEEKQTLYWKNMHFLLKDKIINYAYSSSVYLTNMKPDFNGVSKKGILAFAPVSFDQYQADSIFLDALYTTEKVLRDLGTSFNAVSFEKEQALKDTFLKQINQHNYNIINLLTHADAEGQPHIYFYDKKLLLNELYRLNINTNLMILTACKTGIGTYKKGEGAMSLARGCSYANVPAVVKSLWSLREDSSGEIIYAFHQLLKEGLHKDEALQKAKLDFLEKYGGHKYKTAPSRWAGMVNIGNNQPLYKKPKCCWKWGWLLLCLPVLFLLWKRSLRSYY